MMVSTKDISSLLLFTPQGVNKWKKEQRPIIALLEKYFSKEDLEEFLKTGKIQKLEYVNSYLHGLNLRCHQIYHKIEKLEIKHKHPDVSYEPRSMLISQNFYLGYVRVFIKKHEEIIKNFKVEDFKTDFFNLVLLNHFELKNNGIKEPLVTFQILSILNELSSPELHYFFNEFDKIIHDGMQ